MHVNGLMQQSNVSGERTERKTLHTSLLLEKENLQAELQKDNKDKETIENLLSKINNLQEQLNYMEDERKRKKGPNKPFVSFM